MPDKIFVNLPVNDLEASKKFYEAIGFVNNKQFTDETAAAMVLTDNIYVMLLTHPKFAAFSPAPLADTQKSTAALYAVSFETREEVDEIVKNAVAAGGSTYGDPKDHGFMYQHGFRDPDGHTWEPFYMDPSFVQ
jgi:predicted lactoylglutathione lyase